MLSEAPTNALTVALLTLPETAPGVLYGMHDVLISVGAVWTMATGRNAPVAQRFRPLIVTRDGAPIISPTGPRVDAAASFATLQRPDIVIVTDLVIDMDTAPSSLWADETAWLRAQHAAGAVICSVCTGAVFLAKAGLLDGIEATTHWASARMFGDHFPAVRLKPERILCPSGPEHRIVTAGGASSWTDLALYLIARFAGEDEARRIAKVFVIGDRSDGQLPFAVMARPRQHEDAAVAAAQVWVAEHYATANPVSAMAARAGLPDRTFTRRFRKATGYGPVEYVQTLRIEEAKQILETSSLATDEVALAVGYADPVFFRRLFAREVGVTPARYRQKFGAPRYARA